MKDQALGDVTFKTLLVYPPDSCSRGRYSSIGVPCGLAFLRGFLRERGYSRVTLLHYYRTVYSPAQLGRSLLLFLLKKPEVVNRIALIAAGAGRTIAAIIGSIAHGRDLLRDYLPPRPERFTLSQGLAGGFSEPLDPRTNLFRQFSALTRKGAWRLIGISVETYPQLPYALQIARIVKQSDPRAFLVFGGPVVTQNIDSFTRDPRMHQLIDGFIVKRGEEPLARLIKGLADPAEGREGIPNFYYRTQSGYAACPAAPAPGGEYLKTVPEFGDCALDCLPLLISRGCYWDRCAFCNSRSLDSDFMILKPGEAVEVIKAMQRRYRKSLFEFFDNALPPEFIKGLCRALLEGQVRISWSAKVNADTAFLKEPIPELMKKAGCQAVNIGIESASPRVLKKMCKMQRPEEVVPILHAFNAAGIKVGAFFIFGFPGETREDALETIAFIKANKKLIDNVMPNQFSLQEGTGIHRRAAEFGVRRAARADKNGINFGGFDYEVSEGLTQQEAEIFTEYAKTLQRWR